MFESPSGGGVAVWVGVAAEEVALMRVPVPVVERLTVVTMAGPELAVGTPALVVAAALVVALVTGGASVGVGPAVVDGWP